MTFYYTEPKAGNLWVFALDGARPVREQAGTNLVTLPGGLPRVGEPGATLGGRVLPGYGFPATEGSEPLATNTPAAPAPASEGERANPLSETKKRSLPANASTAPAAWDAIGAGVARVRTSSAAG